MGAKNGKNSSIQCFNIFFTSTNEKLSCIISCKKKPSCGVGWYSWHLSMNTSDQQCRKKYSTRNRITRSAADVTSTRIFYSVFFNSSLMPCWKKKFYDSDFDFFSLFVLKAAQLMILFIISVLVNRVT